MKSLRSFKKYQNLYSKTYYFDVGTFQDMSYVSFNCKLMDRNDTEVPHTKQHFLVCTIDAWGNHANVKYITGLTNAKRRMLDVYDTGEWND